MCALIYIWVDYIFVWCMLMCVCVCEDNKYWLQAMASGLSRCPKLRTRPSKAKRRLNQRPALRQPYAKRRDAALHNCCRCQADRKRSSVSVCVLDLYIHAQLKSVERDCQRERARSCSVSVSTFLLAKERATFPSNKNQQNQKNQIK